MQTLIITSCVTSVMLLLKLVQEVTGHRSLECLRRYEKTTEQNQRAVSKRLTSGSQYNPLIGSEAEPSNSSTEPCPSNALQLNHVHSNELLRIYSIMLHHCYVCIILT